MKQLVQSARTGKLALREVPEPRVTGGHLLVRTRASLISAGTDRMIAEFAQKSLIGKAKARPDLVKKVADKARRDGMAAALRAAWARLDEPLPLGYSAAGVVEAVGAGLEGRFRVGQRVAIAGAGLANHAEVNLVPGNLAAPVPDDANDEEAAFGTLAAIALHAVRNAGLRLGETGAVIGLGLVGQLAARFLALAGVRPVALDYDAGRLELARYGGAEIAASPAENPAEAIRAATGGIGCDAVVIAAATESSEPFELAARIARDRARIVLVGATGTEFSYRDYMAKELSIVVSRSYGPGRYDPDYESRDMAYPPGYVRWTETANLAEAVRLMSRRSDRRLDVEPLITHRFDLADAERAYAMVTGRTEPHLGVVLRYPKQPAARPVVRLRVPAAVAAPAAGRREAVIGVIGAGRFARAEILPRLKGMSGVRLKTVVTRRGASAEHAREKFGFETASADANDVLADPEINAVVIATPHSSHAGLAARALEAGKCVYVEKPLALDRDGINRVVRARNGSAGFFQVGFNRRCAPLAIDLRDKFVNTKSPKSLLIRVNAGALAPDSWLAAPEEGGGRILGELCHFVDLARFLIGAPIASVHATALRTNRDVCEDVSATLSFADGSLATILYTTLGDTAKSKELIEGYVDGTVTAIDDFRQGRRQDKGHAKALADFVDAVRAGGPAPYSEEELIETSLATICVRESLQSGAPVLL